MVWNSWKIILGVFNTILLLFCLFPYFILCHCSLECKSSFSSIDYGLQHSFDLAVIVKNGKASTKEILVQIRQCRKSFLDSLQGLTTLKVYGTDGRREEEIAELSEDFENKP